MHFLLENDRKTRIRCTKKAGNVMVDFGHVKEVSRKSQTHDESVACRANVSNVKVKDIYEAQLYICMNKQS